MIFFETDLHPLELELNTVALAYPDRVYEYVRGENTQSYPKNRKRGDFLQIFAHAGPLVPATFNTVRTKTLREKFLTAGNRRGGGINAVNVSRNADNERNNLGFLRTVAWPEQ